MPENVVLIEKNNNAPKNNLSPKKSFLDYNSRTEKTLRIQEEYSFFRDYSATCGWNNDEVFSRKVDIVPVISPRRKSALPPLASVFSNNKTTQEESDSFVQDNQKNYNINENQDKFYADMRSNPGEQKQDPLQIHSNCGSPLFYSSPIPHTLLDTNKFLHGSNEGSNVMMSSAENGNLIRKRQHSSLKETKLPPNVNTAFKVRFLLFLRCLCSSNGWL